jgi:hypothetical protein
MKRYIIITILAVFTVINGCAAVCNPTGIGIAADNGMNTGSLGIPGLALAGAEIGACGAYRIISGLMESKLANTLEPAKEEKK